MAKLGDLKSQVETIFILREDFIQNKNTESGCYIEIFFG